MPILNSINVVQILKQMLSREKKKKGHIIKLPQFQAFYTKKHFRDDSLL